jgi:hypothetical protein
MFCATGRRARPRGRIWGPAVIASALVMWPALAPGAARAASDGSGGPAVGVDPSSQAQVVFWRAGNGDLIESYRFSIGSDRST